MSFGTGFAIGAWLNYDFDWGGHRIYYHGWQGGGWIGRSRPGMGINNMYVNNNYRNIQVNRTVINDNVNYNNLNRYNSVHRQVDYNNVAPRNRGNFGIQANRGSFGTPGNPGNRGNPNVANRVINDNMNTNDPRIDVYRGRQPIQQPPARGYPHPRQPRNGRGARCTNHRRGKPRGLPLPSLAATRSGFDPRTASRAWTSQPRDCRPVQGRGPEPARQGESVPSCESARRGNRANHPSEEAGNDQRRQLA